MTEPATLRLVDDDGVVIDDDHQAPEEDTFASLRQQLAETKIQLQGAERDVKSWRARCIALEEDQDAKARKSPQWEDIEQLFESWKSLCNHPRSEFTADRFRKALPFFKRHGGDLCLLAIQGAAYDCYEKPQKNGKVKRFNDWKKIFEDEDTFENFCNRASPEDLATYKAKREADDAAT